MTLADLSVLPPVPVQRGGDPTLVHLECIDVIKAAISGTPRSLQKRIGPSEIGHPCTRRIAYKVAGVAEVNSEAGWRPTVGTAVHEWLAYTFTTANKGLPLRWLVEISVEVGDVDGVTISGHVDIYDRITATCNDWKIVSPSSLKNYRAKGPGIQYRVQGHLYAHGLVARGLPVDTVAITFLPNSGELSEAVFWSEPYDESIALAAMERLRTIAGLTKAGGAAAAALLPTDGAEPSWCRYCPFYMPASTDLTVSCPGAVKKPATPAIQPNKKVSTP